MRLPAAGVLLLTALWTACGRLPELAPPSLEGTAPEVRQPFQQAWRNASSHPADPRINGTYGMLCQAYRRWHSAEVAYLRAIAKSPESFEWHYYLAVVRQEQQHDADAALSLRQALRLRPGHADTRRRLAATLLRLGQLAESETLYRELLAANPADAESAFGLGSALRALGQPAAAVDAFENACRLFPPYGAAHYAAAALHRQLKNDDQAKRHLEAYRNNQNAAPRQDNPLLDAVDEMDRSAAALLRRGEVLESAGRHLEAAELLERVLRIDPANLIARTDLVWIYANLGQFEKGERRYREALAMDGKQAKLEVYYCVLLANQGKLADAEKAVRRGLAIDPAYPDAYYDLALVVKRQGRKADAVGYFRQALRQEPNSRKARFELGKLLLEMGREQEAETEFLAMIGATPDQQQYLKVVAKAYRDTRREAARSRFARKAMAVAVAGHLADSRSALLTYFLEGRQ